MSKPVTRAAIQPDPWGYLREFTAARIALGRAGGSLPTDALLRFQLSHAQARDAVLQDLNVPALSEQLQSIGLTSVLLHSAAIDRGTFIRRPDKGRVLSDESIAALEALDEPARHRDVVFVVADGLSALAVARHAAPTLSALMARLIGADWTLAPVCVVSQGRVAVGDEIGALLDTRMVVLLIGERPGLSSPDSLGIYLTYDPAPGRSNAQRNCLSNIRPEGLGYEAAALKLAYLMHEARRRKLSGVLLKEAAQDQIGETQASALPGAATAR